MARTKKRKKISKTNQTTNTSITKSTIIDAVHVFEPERTMPAKSMLELADDMLKAGWNNPSPHSLACQRLELMRKCLNVRLQARKDDLLEKHCMPMSELIESDPIDNFRTEMELRKENEDLRKQIESITGKTDGADVLGHDERGIT